MQANGLDERYNQTLQTMLTKYVQDKKNTWDEYIDTCVFAYNTSQHESTTFTPFELMFGRSAYLSVEVDFDKATADERLEKWQHVQGEDNEIELLTAKRRKDVETARIRIKEAQVKQKHYYDLKHCKPGAFDIGSQVLMKDLSRKKRKGGKLNIK